jgi:hypothetical protein
MEPKSIKNLRQVISKLDLWLGALEPIIIGLQKHALKARGHKLENISASLNGLLDNAANLRSYIDSEREALGLLKRSPPGIVSAIFDFLYSASVDPKAPSKKQEYLTKLREIDKTLVRKKVSDNVSSSMSLPPEIIETTVRTEVQSLILTWIQNKRVQSDFQSGSSEAKKLEESIITKTMYLINQILSGQDLQDDMVVLTQEFAKGLEKVEITDLYNFMQSLRISLSKAGISPESDQKLGEGIQKVLTTKQSTALSGIVVYSTKNSREDLIKIFEADADLLKRFFDSIAQKVFPNKVDELLGQLKNKVSTKDMETAQRYHRYVNQLFGPSSHNIASYMTEIKKSITSLIAILKATDISKGNVIQLTETEAQAAEAAKAKAAEAKAAKAKAEDKINSEL